MVSENINNPKIYNKIYDLIYFYLKRRHLLNYEQEYEEVAHIGTVDLYLKVYNGNEIHSWLGYISLAYKAYIREYRKLYRSEIIDTEGNPDLRDAISIMSSASSMQNNIDYETTLNLKYIEDLESVIDSILDISKYMKYTSEYYNAKLSIIISLYNDKFLSYGLNTDNKIYVHMLYVRTKEEIIKDIGLGTYNLNNMLWQYTMECRDVSSDEV